MSFNVLYIPVIVISILLFIITVHLTINYEDVKRDPDNLTGRTVVILILVVILTIYTYKVALLLNQTV